MANAEPKAALSALLGRVEGGSSQGMTDNQCAAAPSASVTNHGEA
jgi:hypothetical protein